MFERNSKVFMPILFPVNIDTAAALGLLIKHSYTNVILIYCIWLMRKVLVVLLAFLSLQPVYAEQRPVLEWCLDDHPNWHNYPDDGEPYGLTVDLMQLIAERANIEIRFSPKIPFVRCLLMMKNGQTDLMTSLNYTDERSAYMHLLPYDTAKPEVLFLRAEQHDIQYREQLFGKTVILVRGYAYNAELAEIIGRKHITIVEATSLDMAFAMLLLGRADALIGPAQSSINVLSSNPRYDQQFKQASFALPFKTLRQVNLGLSRNSPHSHLHKQLQTVIDSLIAEGLITRFRYDKEAAKNE